MKVLFCAAEAAPLVKVGGLGDVVGALPKALAARGHDARIIIPADRQALSSAGARPAGRAFAVEVRGTERQVSILETALSNGTPVYLADCPFYFDRARVYGEPDDLDRFLCFSKACIGALVNLDWTPDVLHVHDWHTAMVASFLKVDMARAAPFDRMGVVLTIHNLAYQGWFDRAWAASAGVLHHLPGPEQPLHALLWRALALGILRADAVTAVSETYAREIVTPEYGHGLDPLLRQRGDALTGILNGVDYDAFSPDTDPHLVQPYSAASLEGKAANKAALQARMGLEPAPGAPVIGNVGRLARMKGVELICDAARALLEEGAPAQFALLGSGEPDIEASVKRLAVDYPGRVGVRLGYDAALASLIYAGSDIFVMPSLFEPCGLSQMIALRYGAVPVVRQTGGLADTICEDERKGNGFVCRAPTVPALVAALQRALDAYADRPRWNALVQRGMACDYSWDRSAARYEDVYNRALAARLGDAPRPEGG